MSEPEPTPEMRQALSEVMQRAFPHDWHRLMPTAWDVFGPWLASREAAAKAEGMRAVLKYAEHQQPICHTIGPDGKRMDRCGCGLEALKWEAGE